MLQVCCVLLSAVCVLLFLWINRIQRRLDAMSDAAAAFLEGHSDG